LHYLYNIAIKATDFLLPLAGRYNEKLGKFSQGRKDLFESLAAQIAPTEKTIWIHAASLGEYEQAVPVIIKLKDLFPTYKIVLSFFSPSGFEVKKKNSLAHVVTYLPLDTPANAEKFLNIVHPDWALFIKYEFWPNFLKELKKRELRSVLISGAFRENQVFFKPYGKWMRKYLKAFEFFFVQNERSKQLLQQIGFENCSVSGDTRFDRVYAQLQQDNHLDFVEEFVDDHLCIVAGSTWPEDEDLIIDFVNKEHQKVKFIIAPHAIKPEKIKNLQSKLEADTILFSEKEGETLKDANVLIVDTVGLLTKIYSYAQIAYVGGAAGNTGLHNILEPAAFGVPVIIGQNFEKFPEAGKLKEAGGLFSVKNSDEANDILDKLINDRGFREKAGKNSVAFIEKNKGATNKIYNYFLKTKEK
jgi:3-deoxy-D-manno-octulosonic-acid transferase